MRKERRLRVYESRVLRRIFGPRKDEVKGVGENHVMRIFINTAPNQVLFRWSNKEEWDGLGM